MVSQGEMHLLFQEKRSGPSHIIQLVSVLVAVPQSDTMNYKTVIARSLTTLEKNSWTNSSLK